MHRDPRPGLLAAALAVPLLTARMASASEGGIVLWPDPPLLLVMMALFALLLVPVNTMLFRPLLRALDLRIERTLGTRTRAAKLAASADEILARYEQAVRDVRAEAEQEIERARREVAGALAAARARLRAEVEPLGREAASRVLGRVVS